MQRRTWPVTMACALALTNVACGSSAPPPQSSEVNLAPPPEGRGVQLELAWTLEPGEEKTSCSLLRMPAGDAPVYVTAFEHQFTKNASHHLLLYSTPLTADEAAAYPDVMDCNELANARTGVYYGAQAPTGRTALPADVGLLVSSGAVLLYEFHTINPTSKPADVRARLNVEYTDVAPAKQAGTLFHYTPAIHVAPFSTATAGMTCKRPTDINLVSIASHMHARGIGFSAKAMGGASGELGLYETNDWESPQQQVFDPPLRITMDQAIEFECRYDNPSDREYFAGLSAENDEMCVLLGLYYADEGVNRMDQSAEWCGNGADGSHPRQFGTGSCKDARVCLEEVNAAVGFNNPITTPIEWQHRWQTCFTEASDEAAALLVAYRDCRNAACSTTCVKLVSDPDGGSDLNVWDFANPECEACISESCGAERQTCDAS